MSIGAALLFAVMILGITGSGAQTSMARPPKAIQDTGLYSDFEKLEINPAHLSFSPQYPLWTDGATKRRWISLPAGTAVDGSEPDAWRFPAGTRLWKEFSFDGKRIETRYMERQANGQWLYAAYAWSADGREALLASDRGKRGAYPLGEGRSHTIPSVSDCKVCHQAAPSQVLGFSALQLSSVRDPLAPHAEPRPAPGVDLQFLMQRGLIVGLPQSLQDNSPRIMASSAPERAALGYLHGNCGHCHNDQGPLKNIGLFLRYVPGAAVQPAMTSTIGAPIKKPAPGQSPDALLRVEPRHPDRSGLLQRMGSRYPALQMPPLGTELIDKEAVSVIHRWITEVDELRKEAHWEHKGMQ